MVLLTPHVVALIGVLNMLNYIDTADTFTNIPFFLYSARFHRTAYILLCKSILFEIFYLGKQICVHEEYNFEMSARVHKVHFSEYVRARFITCALTHHRIAAQPPQFYLNIILYCMGAGAPMPHSVEKETYLLRAYG